MAVSSRSCASATPAGSGGTSRRPGQRASASPRRIPARTPNASAAAEASPTTGSRPGFRGQGERCRQLGVAPGGDREREARDLQADDHPEHMFARVGAGHNAGGQAVVPT
jgi:hypothetical protein